MMPAFVTQMKLCCVALLYVLLNIVLKDEVSDTTGDAQ